MRPNVIQRNLLWHAVFGNSIHPAESLFRKVLPIYYTVIAWDRTDLPKHLFARKYFIVVQLRLPLFSRSFRNAILNTQNRILFETSCNCVVNTTVQYFAPQRDGNFIATFLEWFLRRCYVKSFLARTKSCVSTLFKQSIISLSLWLSVETEICTFGGELPRGAFQFQKSITYRSSKHSVVVVCLTLRPHLYTWKCCRKITKRLSKNPIAVTTLLSNTCTFRKVRGSWYT